MDAPAELSPRDAWDRYVSRRSTETTAGSQKTYHYRLKLFVEWCEENNIQTVSEFSGWLFEQYESKRAGELAASTLNGEMQTIKNFVEYLERIEAVDEDLSEKVHVPIVPEGEEASDVKLSTEDARALLTYYRNNEDVYGRKHHALLELLWHSGARLGAVRGLDVRDFDEHAKLVTFTHRPESDTPLKNKRHGERAVALHDEVVDAISNYLTHHRWETHDDHGRQPLFSTAKGRPSRNTIRVWCYQATLPCLHSDCPHGHERETCEFTEFNSASKCPSSRSPHQVRTGSITWHRDCEFPRSVTSERVNASQRVIDRHYDKSTHRDRMEHRRRPHLDKLSLDDE
ncbi:tyrosine-type recombinase/integrase [Natranaeroarchaeum aerophilus]|uniref:Tyrosine-type recombinase/integrase n=1 Tax=Natranaeroarchaeum aerophilus TaxID=2917711 RepID=A0AAE3K3A1_9EURY|nr:tyrosine-type recombinase/integrase [Natranaeroarchaeum aerophilus]MCL9812502.1 tyrosine-type recombinase/integrase [Natranaeroarchaeum aerophilus]